MRCHRFDTEVDGGRDRLAQREADPREQGPGHIRGSLPEHEQGGRVEGRHEHGPPGHQVLHERGQQGRGRGVTGPQRVLEGALDVQVDPDAVGQGCQQRCEGDRPTVLDLVEGQVGDEVTGLQRGVVADDEDVVGGAAGVELDPAQAAGDAGDQGVEGVLHVAADHAATGPTVTQHRGATPEDPAVRHACARLPEVIAWAQAG